jgi:hypothetical protein
VKQKVVIAILFAVVAAILIGLNLASYSQRPREADNESSPNRSTFNSGATGTLAYFSLLTETGIRTVRWQQPPAALLTETRNVPTHFVIVGELRRSFTEDEAAELLSWVSMGGQLIVIDRDPPEDLISASRTWKLAAADIKYTSLFDTDPADSDAMTAGAVIGKPVNPTVVTGGVKSVQPSIFASTISIGSGEEGNAGDVPAETEGETFRDAPVAHVAAAGRNLVVDAAYGQGRIIFVSDPYIVSNVGIAHADNAHLAVNLVRSNGGIVAFDEYHQGYGANNNRFLEFFASTPVAAIFFQLLVVAGFLFYSQSRRFARPINEPEPNRLSKLEYVSAMAALQQRVRAYDLAVENIYRDFKLRAVRLFGLDLSNASASKLAAAVSERVSVPRQKLEADFDECEQIIYGENVGKSRVVELIGTIRELEAGLGLRRRTETK